MAYKKRKQLHVESWIGSLKSLIPVCTASIATRNSYIVPGSKFDTTAEAEEVFVLLVMTPVDVSPSSFSVVTWNTLAPGARAQVISMEFDVTLTTSKFLGASGTENKKIAKR